MIKCRRTVHILLALTPTVFILLFIGDVGHRIVGANDAIVRYVAPGADCNGASPCYSTPQAAVDSAASGDEIRVAAGTYTETNQRGLDGRAGPGSQILYLEKSLTIRGGYTIFDWDNNNPAANPTILDAQGNGRVIYAGQNITATIEGLHITGGDSTGQDIDDYGGGIYAALSTLIISNSVIYDNYAAGLSGAVYIVGGDGSQLLHNEIRENIGFCNGGVFIFGENVIVRGNTFEANELWGGNCNVAGGLGLYGDGGLVENNLFTENLGSSGGAFSIHGQSTISANTFLTNSANYGGAIYFAEGPLITGNIIAHNLALWGGGGVAGWIGDATLISNVIVENELFYVSAVGGGVFIGAGATRLVHNSIAGNEDSGVATIGWPLVTATIELENNAILSHTVGVSVAEGDIASLDGTLWGTGVWANGTDWTGAGTVTTGTVNVWGDPVFVNPAGLDYRISGASDAIDAGIDAGVLADADGNSRPSGCNFDIGAYEYQGGPCIIPTTGGFIQNTGVHLTIPAGTFSETVMITLTVFPSGSINFPPPGLIRAGNEFGVHATFIGGSPAQPLSGRTYTMTAAYDPVRAGLFFDQTALYYWAGVYWGLEPTSVNDPNAYQVTATPGHLSGWALFAPEEGRLYMPVLRKGD